MEGHKLRQKLYLTVNVIEAYGIRCVTNKSIQRAFRGANWAISTVLQGMRN